MRFFLAMPVQVYAWLGRPVYTYFVTLALTLAYVLGVGGILLRCIPIKAPTVQTTKSAPELAPMLAPAPAPALALAVEPWLAISADAAALAFTVIWVFAGLGAALVLFYKDDVPLRGKDRAELQKHRDAVLQVQQAVKGARQLPRAGGRGQPGAGGRRQPGAGGRQLPGAGDVELGIPQQPEVVGALPWCTYLVDTILNRLQRTERGAHNAERGVNYALAPRGIRDEVILRA